MKIWRNAEMIYAMLSMLIPKELEEEYRKNTRNTMQDAANVLQWKIYEGLSNNLKQEITLFNVLPVDSFPQYYRYPFIRSRSFEKCGYNIGFCNIKLIRNYAKTIAIYKILRKWCMEHKEQKVLFVYTLSRSFVVAVDKIKNEFPELKICAIVADLPDMSSLSTNKSKMRILFTGLQSKRVYNSLNKIDCFVLLTEHMAEYMGIHQPFCVMEGIADVRDNIYIKNTCDSSIKKIVYTGTLHKKFGIIHLLEAFERIYDPMYRLILCGIGDGEDEIKKAIHIDSRIQYMGQLKRDKVLELQKEATVLVNPRLNDEEFTKYSFPSKTMEYLASGIPVIAYKLDGIPAEYDRYVQYPKDETVNSLADKIVEICNMDKKTRKELSQSSIEFVMSQKNKDVQTKKILELVEGIF